MGIFLGRKTKRREDNTSSGSIPEEKILDQRDFQKYDLYKKGINSMSNEKFEGIWVGSLRISLADSILNMWTPGLKKDTPTFTLENSIARSRHMIRH